MTELSVTLARMCVDQLARWFVIYPLGRCVDSVLKEFEDIPIDLPYHPFPVWTGPERDLPFVDQILVMVVDDRDEALLQDVGRVCARCVDPARPTAIVVLGTNRSAAELHRLSRHWNAAIVAVPATAAESLGLATAGIVDGLLRCGLICCSPDDFATVLAPPAVGTYLSTPYESNGESWTLPQAWKAPLAAADGLVLNVHVNVGAETTLHGIDCIASQIYAAADEKANIFFAGPDSGRPTNVTVVAVSKVPATPDANAPSVRRAP